MTPILLAGAVVGLGVLVLVAVLVPPRTRAAGALARLDRERSQQRAEAVALRLDPQRADAAPWKRELGQRVTATLAGLGVELGQLRSDLAILGRTLDAHLATTALAGVGGLVAPLIVSALLVLGHVGLGASVPLLLSVVMAVAGCAVPWTLVHSQAAARRRDFRHVVGSFLDLVAMSLAGGRGVPEALQGASELSDGWAMVRIRNALVGARLRGETPWAALGELGQELRIDELRDLAAALALVAEDGAKVRDSLAARAASMRRRELSESEGKAGESSQSMLVAQLLLCVGFLVFLIYPAMMTVLGGG